MPASHGEGRFLCPPDALAKLSESGQIAAQYVDEQGRASNPGAALIAAERLAGYHVDVGSDAATIADYLQHNQLMGEALVLEADGTTSPILPPATI